MERTLSGNGKRSLRGFRCLGVALLISLLPAMWQCGPETQTHETHTAAIVTPEREATRLIDRHAPRQQMTPTSTPSPTSGPYTHDGVNWLNTTPPIPSAAPTPSPTQPAPSPKVLERGICQASFYHEGNFTASEEPFNPDGLTAAHRHWAFGTIVRVTNLENGMSVTVEITDRGPSLKYPSRCIDLARGAFSKLASVDPKDTPGVIDVRYEVLSRPTK